MSNQSGRPMTPRYTITQGGTVMDGNFPPVDSPTHGQPQVKIDIAGPFRVTVTVQFGSAPPFEVVIELNEP